MNTTPPPHVVEMIIPLLHRKNIKNIWCPFDTADSKFVTILSENGFNIAYGHIFTGQDFFDYENPPDGTECVVSNPPFSKRNAIFKRLYEFDIPFALVMNFNGLFDSKERYDLFRDKEVELYIPKGRMKFITKDKGQMNSPNFQSVYVCSKMLDNKIEFADFEF